MKKIINLYYEGYPVCFNEYIVSNGSIIAKFQNINSMNITNVVLSYLGEAKSIDLNTNDELFEVVINDIDENLVGQLELISITANSKIYKLEDYKNKSSIIKPKNVSFLGRERHLFIYDFCKKNNVSKSHVKFLPADYKSYWNCVCGETNFNKDECKNCKLKKEDVFFTDYKYEKESYYTNGKLNVIFSGLIFTVIIYFILMLIQGIGGDFFFDNAQKNNFLGTFNRIVVPLTYIVLTGINLYAISSYKVKLEKTINIINVCLVIYLNLFTAIFTINSAYNVIFILALDIIDMVSIIAYYKNYDRIRKFNIAYIGIIFAMLICSIVKISIYSSYELKVIDNGIHLYVEVDEDVKEYSIPASLDGLKVTKVSFSDQIKYNIETMYISEYVEEILMHSHITLPKLTKIELASENKSLYIKDGVLYNKNNLVEIVPTSVKSLELNSEVIHKEAFKDALGLETIYIGKDVKEIAVEAFSGCINLKQVIFDEDTKIEKIDDYAFKNCGLISIELPKSLMRLGEGILAECKSLEKLKAPFLGYERETEIKDYTAQDLFTKFFGSGDYSCYFLIPESLKEVEIYDIVLIHNVTFYKAANVEKIVLPDELLFMGSRSFYECKSLKEFKISNGIEAIKESCFQNCSSLKKIVIPDSVKTIEKNAFLGCDALIEVIYEGDINELVIAEGNDIIKEILYK